MQVTENLHFHRPVFPNLLEVGEQLAKSLLENRSYLEHNAIFWEALQDRSGNPCGPRLGITTMDDFFF